MLTSIHYSFRKQTFTYVLYIYVFMKATTPHSLSVSVRVIFVIFLMFCLGVIKKHQFWLQMSLKVTYIFLFILEQVHEVCGSLQ